MTQKLAALFFTCLFACGCALGAAPANDNFTSATLLNSAVPFTANGTNASATSEPGEPHHAGTSALKSVWFAWSPPASASTMLTTAGSALDATLAVYTGTALNALTKVAANADTVASTVAANNVAQVAFYANAGTTYYIAVDGFNGAENTFTLNFTVAPQVSVTASDPNAAEAGLDPGTFTITRVGSITAPLTVYFDIGGTAEPSVDYLRLLGTVTIPVNSASVNVVVTPIDNTRYNPDATVILTLLSPPGASPDPDANGIVVPTPYAFSAAQSTATVTIADNDPVAIDKADAVSFSQPHGFCDTPVNLTLMSTTPGAQIRYTLDGSVPTASSTLYSTPILVSQTSVYRAVAFKAGLNPSKCLTSTYVFVNDVINQSPNGAPPAGWPSSWGQQDMLGANGINGVQNNKVDYGMDPAIVSANIGTIKSDLKALPVISVVMKLDDLFNPSTNPYVGGIYANSFEESVLFEKPCSIELFDPADTLAGFQANCGVRIRGGASAIGLGAKHSLRFYFRDEYGGKSLNYPLFGADPAPKSFQQFDLAAFSQDSWSSWQGNGFAVYIRDLFAHDTHLAMNRVTPRTNYYHMYLNGQYWGVGYTEEHAEGNFASSYFGGDANDYDIVKAKYGFSYATSGYADAWNNLWKLCKSGLSGNTNYYAIQGRNADGSLNPAYENLLEMDELIDFMLVHYYIGNLDGPISAVLGGNPNGVCNNFIGARRRDGSAGFRFFVHDAEYYNFGSSEVNRNRLGPWTGGTNLQNVNPQWLFQQGTANAEFRVKLMDALQRHFFNGGVLTSAACTNRFNARKAQIDHPLYPESARWGNVTGTSYTHDNWTTQTNSFLGTYLQQRSGIVLNQFISAGYFPSLQAPTFSQAGGNIPGSIVLTVSNPNNPTGKIYYTIDGSDPRKIGGQAQGTDGGLSANIPISTTTTVRARIFNTTGAIWSPIQEATYVTAQDYSKLKVTEIMYNPPDQGVLISDDLEFIELKNTGPVALNLSGAQFTQGITYAFPLGASINPGQIIVLCSNTSAFGSRYPTVVPYAAYSGHLSNSGETLTLVNSSLVTILSFSYADNVPWPVTPDGLGFSLVPIDPATISNFSDAKQWRASTNALGSPGVDDPVNTIGSILINEALTHVDPPDHEYIELRNPGLSTVNIGGWYLTDDRHVPQKFRIPNNAFLEPGGFAVFDDTQYNPNPGIDPSFALDSHGDDLYLFSANPATGALTGYSHGFSFGAAQNPVAFGRYVISTGAEHFVTQISNTPGATNSGPKVGPVVISEIMYLPGPGGDQFIELLNITNSAVQLFDPNHPANTWILKGVDYTFPQGIQLPAGQVCLLCAGDPITFRTKYNVAAGVQIFGPWLGTLKTGGDDIELQKPDNPDPVVGGGFFVPYVAVDRVEFQNLSPWPLEPAGTGPSLLRINPLAYGNDPINWVRSPSNGGTPGVGDNLAPTAPTGLSAVTASSSAINLSWTDNAYNELNFTIQRSLDGANNWSTVNQVGANVTSYQDFNLAGSTTFFYRVFATGVFGDSAFSNVANATTQVPPAPNAPAGLIATVLSQSKIQLAWNDLSSNETTFKVERSPDGISGWVAIAQTPADTATYLDSGLSPNTSYSYRVSAINQITPSGFSNTVSAKTQIARMVNFRTNGGFVHGMQGTLFVDLISVGAENSVAFSVTFPSALSNPVVAKGPDSGAGVTLTTQTSGSAVGIALSAPGGAFGGGTKTIAQITFDVAAGGGNGIAALNFADVPQARSVLAVNGTALEVAFQDNFSVNIVNDVAPVAANGSITTAEETPVQGFFSATDLEHNPLTFFIASNPAKGTVVLNNASTGAFTYTPSLNATGSDSFTFKANDGFLDSNAGTISITITPVNDPPVASPLTFSTPVNFVYPGTLPASDIDGDVLNYSIVSNGAQGTAVVVNAATGAFTYTPNDGSSGSDTFTFKVSDGQYESNTASVSVTITAPNHAPVATGASFGTLEETPHSGTLVAADPDNDPLLYTIVAMPAKGTVQLGAGGAFTYTPNLDAAGEDSFSFKVSDGFVDSNTAVINITVINVDDVPVAVGGSLTTPQDKPFSGTLAGSDADNDPLTFSIVTAASKGVVTITNTATGAFTYTPSGAVGSDSFKFKVNDTHSDSNTATMSVAITPVNHAPVAVDFNFSTLDSKAFSGKLSATDPEGDALNFRVSADGTKGKVVITNAATGAFTYTPSGSTGADKFTFVANDGTADSNTALVSVTIAATPPVITSPSTLTGDARVNFAQTLSASGTAPILFAATGLPAGLALDGATITGTVAAGTYLIHVTATNAGGTNSQDITLIFNNPGGAANQAPVLASNPTATPAAGVVGAPVSFAAAATDANGDQLSYAWNFGDAITGSGASTQHAYAAPGVYTVEVTVSDGAAKDSASLVFAVSAVSQSGTLAVSAASLTFSFSPGAAKDALSLSATLPVSQGTTAAGTHLKIWVGGLAYEFTLDKSGKAKLGTATVKFSGVKKGAFGGASTALKLDLKKQKLYDALKDLGFSNSTGSQVTLPIALEFGKAAYTSECTLNYTVKPGKSGSGKTPK